MNDTKTMKHSTQAMQGEATRTATITRNKHNGTMTIELVEATTKARRAITHALPAPVLAEVASTCGYRACLTALANFLKEAKRENLQFAEFDDDNRERPAPGTPHQDAAETKADDADYSLAEHDRYLTETWPKPEGQTFSRLGGRMTVECGVTSVSLKNAEALAEKLGPPVRVIACTGPDVGEQEIVASYPGKPEVFWTFTGLSWGYRGEGPHGTLEFLRRFCGFTNLTIEDIEALKVRRTKDLVRHFTKTTKEKKN